MTNAIADASAILACVAGEAGGSRLARYRSINVCAVNHAEIIGRLVGWGLDEAAMDAALRKTVYRIHPFDGYRADITGRLCRHPLARRLSLGDRACLSLALRTGLPVLTADRAWAELELGVDVRLIR